jgi:hypothetical protein
LHNLQYDEGDNHMAEAETETVLFKCQTETWNLFIYSVCSEYCTSMSVSGLPTFLISVKNMNLLSSSI